jgi:hypothetical protein
MGRFFARIYASWACCQTSLARHGINILLPLYLKSLLTTKCAKTAKVLGDEPLVLEFPVMAKVKP